MSKTFELMAHPESLVVHNTFQGDDPKVLFVCSAGILRSATAARIFADKWNTRSAGSSPIALIPVTKRLLNWADFVFFMKEENFIATSKQFDLDKFDCFQFILDIPDNFNHMQPELIQLLKEKVSLDSWRIK